MGHSQATKQNNREKIIKEAARQIRTNGLSSIRTRDLMKSVGLTHGGFYGHFGSLHDLLDEAVERALEDSIPAFLSMQESGQVGFAELVNSYLSRIHRDNSGHGCALAALAGEIGRDGAPGKTATTDMIQTAFKLLNNYSRDDNATAATYILSTLVGALTLARAVDDQKLSDKILKDAAAALINWHNSVIDI